MAYINFHAKFDCKNFNLHNFFILFLFFLFRFKSTTFYAYYYFERHRLSGKFESEHKLFNIRIFIKLPLLFCFNRLFDDANRIGLSYVRWYRTSVQLFMPKYNTFPAAYVDLWSLVYGELFESRKWLWSQFIDR